MKNQLPALTAVIGGIIIGGITSTLTLLPPAQALTVTNEGNGVIAIGVGKNLPSTKGKSIEVPWGTKIYFKCKDTTTTYDSYEISPINARVSQANGSQSDLFRFPQKGTYKFSIQDQSGYNDGITVIVK